MAEQPIVQDSIGKIVDAILAGHENPISGADLMELIVRTAPELNVRSIVGIPVGQPGALKKFVQDYLREYLEINGNKGSDVLYKVKGKLVVPHASSDPGFWKSFISPGAPNRLFVDLPAKRLVHKSQPPAENKDHFAEIPRVSAEEHEEIRSGFVDSLSTEERPLVAHDSEQSKTFSVWIENLRSHPKLYRNWSVFRRTKLEQLFADRLAAIAVADDVAVLLKSQMGRSQSAAKAKSQYVTSQTEHQTANSQRLGQSPIDEPSQARRLLEKALKVMSRDEIRSIRLSVGTVLDAMNSKD